MTRGPWLPDGLRAQGPLPAVLSDARTVTYPEVAASFDRWCARLAEDGVQPGRAVLFDAGYTADAIALFLALLHRGCIAVPLTAQAVARMEVARAIACPTHHYRRGPEAAWLTESCPDGAVLPLYEACRSAGQGGLVIFTSGSTGVPKASLHRADRFLSKFEKKHTALRTLLVLPFDHMAGLDSLFYALTSGSCVVVPSTPDPAGICDAIARHQAELLPATPSLLNLLWLSGCLDANRLASLKLITYGAEVMPAITLQRLREALPHCRFLQKYGATEFGSPPTRSREDGSLWFKINSDAFETRVVDGLLWVRSPSSMLGYLNAPSPISEDGWINTGDRVEVEGDYLRVLGRQSEMINVGGQKVNPAEVENVLLAADNIRDASVKGEKNPILGHTVAATVLLRQPEDLPALRNRLRLFCRERLPREATPVRIDIADETLWNTRFKKIRNPTA